MIAAAQRMFLLDAAAGQGCAAMAHPASGIALADKNTKARERQLNCIVPISFTMVQDVLYAACYPELRNLVWDYLNSYRENPFAEDALMTLNAAIRPSLAAWGYRQSPFAARYAVSRLLTSVPDASCVLSGTKRLTAEDVSMYRCMISFRMQDALRRGAYVHIVDGMIVAAAAVNTATDKAYCTEIGVECTCDYRRNGYALSCTAALTRDLLQHGKIPLYQHYVTNTASGALAEKLGFSVVGRFYTYTAVR